MIDREARNEAAELLRHFVSGQITNFSFEDSYPVSSDPAISAIENTVWCFYDDTYEHTMSGGYKLDRKWKNTFARWIIFLHTDNEYLWPKVSYPGIRPIKIGWISRMLGREKKIKKDEKRFMESGDYKFWPFIDQQSFECANSAPRLCNNS